MIGRPGAGDQAGRAALTDPEPTVESLQDTHRRLLANSRHQENLIEALLMLARSQRGIESRQPVALAVVVQEVVATREDERVRLDTDLAPATVFGDTIDASPSPRSNSSRPSGWARCSTTVSGSGVSIRSITV